jgi:hypothetical protein
MSCLPVIIEVEGDQLSGGVFDKYERSAPMPDLFVPLFFFAYSHACTIWGSEPGVKPRGPQAANLLEGGARREQRYQEQISH